MKIIWSNNAERTLDEILGYLSNEFSEKEAIRFNRETQRILKLIKTDPFLFRASSQNIRSAVIHKFTTLYYKIDFEKEEINLISFFQTRKDPNKKPL